MFQALISPIASLAGTWLEGRVDKAKAVADLKKLVQEEAKKESIRALKLLSRSLY